MPKPAKPASPRPLGAPVDGNAPAVGCTAAGGTAAGGVANASVPSTVGGRFCPGGVVGGVVGGVFGGLVGGVTG